MESVLSPKEIYDLFVYELDGAYNRSASVEPAPRFVDLEGAPIERVKTYNRSATGKFSLYWRLGINTEDGYYYTTIVIETPDDSVELRGRDHFESIRNWYNAPLSDKDHEEVQRSLGEFMRQHALPMIEKAGLIEYFEYREREKNEER